MSRVTVRRAVVQQRWAELTDQRRHLLGAVLAVALLLSGLTAGIPDSGGAFRARITNSTNTAAAARYFTCQAAAVGDSAFFAYPLTENPVGTTATDVSGNTQNGTYQGTPTHSTSSACTRDGGGSTTFDGTSTYVSTPTAQTNPQTFTSEIWFRTTTTTGGELIGFSSVQTGATNQHDRHLYMTNAGKLVFGVYNSGVYTITSPSAYNNGAWHHTAATLSPAGLQLYVDGAQVAASTATTAAESYTGYWRIGQDNLSGWTDVPTSQYFTGQLSYAAVYTTALTATTIAAHNRAGR